MCLSESQIRLRCLSLRHPEISQLIDEFGLMLKEEYDERSSNSVCCDSHVFRRNRTIHPDFRDDNPYFVPRNCFESFFDEHSVVPVITQLKLF